MANVLDLILENKVVAIGVGAAAGTAVVVGGVVTAVNKKAKKNKKHHKHNKDEVIVEVVDAEKTDVIPEKKGKVITVELTEDQINTITAEQLDQPHPTNFDAAKKKTSSRKSSSEK